MSRSAPCTLALTLLARADVCPSCGHRAGVHTGWLRELERGAIPNPGAELEEELELEADDGDQIAAALADEPFAFGPECFGGSDYPSLDEEERELARRVRWAVGGGSPWRGASPPASPPPSSSPAPSSPPSSRPLGGRLAPSRRARLVALALRTSAASLLELAAALEEELEEGA